jgi:uncharacterized protein YraI
MRKILLLPLLLLLTGCSFAVSVQDTATPTAVPFVTATLLASVTPYPTATYAPPTITPTIEPLEALTNAQVNVRSGPAQTNASLGLIDFGTKVQLIGKNTDGTWYRIVYKDAAEGTGWVTANFITFGGDVDKIPVVDAAPVAATPPDGTPATAAPSPTAKGKTSSVTAKINVRAGPATSFDSLGMIEADTTVTLTGRNEINNWVQIQFADAPDGKGWVAALYLKDPDLRGLPVYGNDGKLISGSTPQPNPGEPTPTPTGYAPAAADNDSASNPGVRQTLSTDGAGVLIYSSELSSPDGDNTDWVAFTLDGPASQSSYLYFRLDCTGNNAILATLQKDGKPVADTKTLQCGNYDLAMKVLDGQEYMLVLRADTAGTLRFVSYKLTIKASR